MSAPVLDPPRARRVVPEWFPVWAAAVIAITIIAAGLRLWSLRLVPLDPFYDASVRSMGRSWHNFFTGAFDPGAQTSIDKPPIDLWLQVASVKLLGLTATTLKLPEAVGGTLAVPLLYDAVRRIAGRPAGLVAASALAVLPLSVLTSRSDTMDSVMMLALVGVAWLLVWAAGREGRGQLAGVLAAAAVLGVAFNIKLFEALVPAPAFLCFAVLALRGSRRRRGALIAVAAVVFAASSLWWMIAVSLVPAHDRPFALGSTDGTVWNAVFVFNGTDRLLGKVAPDRFGAPTSVVLAAASSPAGALPRRRRSGLTQTSPPGPLRLLSHNAVDYGGLLGVELLAGGVLCLLALILARAWRWRPGAGPIPLGAAAGGALAAWLVVGVVLFSFAARVHPRYLEAFSPAVAAALGAGLVAVAARVRERGGTPALLLALVLAVVEAAVATGSGSTVRAGLVASVAVAVVVGLAGAGALVLARRGGRAGWWTPAAAGAGVLLAVLAFPVARDVSLIDAHDGDEAATLHFDGRTLRALSTRLRARPERYEAAVSAPSVAAPLIAHDGRPVLLLDSIGGHALVSADGLRRAVAAGEVSYLLTRGGCPRPTSCGPALRWAVAHGRDVSASLHSPADRRGVLYRLAGARG